MIIVVGILLGIVVGRSIYVSWMAGSRLWGAVSTLGLVAPATLIPSGGAGVGAFYIAAAALFLLLLLLPSARNRVDRGTVDSDEGAVDA